MNTKAIGEITEAVVLAELVRNGYVVLLPFGDNQRYDMVVDTGSQFITIQCKTACESPNEGSIVFPTCSSSYHRGGPKKGYKGEVDYFAVYYPGNRQVYMVKVDEVGDKSAHLRLEPSKSGQESRVRYAHDYLLENWLGSSNGRASV